MRWYYALGGAAGIGAAVGRVLSYVIARKRVTIDKRRVDIAEVEIALNAFRDLAASVHAELELTRRELTVTRNELFDTRAKLAAAQGEVKALSEELAKARGEIHQLRQQINK